MQTYLNLKNYLGSDVTIYICQLIRQSLVQSMRRRFSQGLMLNIHSHHIVLSDARIKAMNLLSEIKLRFIMGRNGHHLVTLSNTDSAHRSLICDIINNIPDLNLRYEAYSPPALTKPAGKKSIFGMIHEANQITRRQSDIQPYLKIYSKF